MKTLTAQLISYSAYHQDPRNKATHFVGVPLVVFSLFLPLGWLRFAPNPELPITGATLAYAAVFLYYLRLDWQIALLQLPASIAILYLADVSARLPFGESAEIFAATFVGGWIIQLIGHWFEGKKPALLDNLSQVFNAPLFLTAEVLFLLGMRKEQRAAVEQAH